MKQVSEAMADHLASGVTTLCTCFRLTRTDAQVLGFTDHDHDLVFGDTLFEATSAFQASELEEAIGLGVDNLDIEAALNSITLMDEELEAGLYDHAKVEVYRVNWQAPDQQHMLIKTGHLGEMQYGDGFFKAEIRGLSHLLQQPKGRHFQHTCDAVLGDAKCGVDLSDAHFRTLGELVEIADRHTLIFELEVVFDNGWFDYGELHWDLGQNNGQITQIRSGKKLDGLKYRLDFRAAQPFTPQVGDMATLLAGCNRHLSACRDKFANVANYRGFPHMPGNDFLMKIPSL